MGSASERIEKLEGFEKKATGDFAALEEWKTGVNGRLKNHAEAIHEQEDEHQNFKSQVHVSLEDRVPRHAVRTISILWAMNGGLATALLFALGVVMKLVFG